MEVFRVFLQKRKTFETKAMTRGQSYKQIETCKNNDNFYVHHFTNGEFALKSFTALKED